ncbi:MAG TPA: biopolymer transporter ExbD [Myxococcales bacterium]|nr:biopolymer transporter ExbD [Myxococcales bacterium]
MGAAAIETGGKGRKKALDAVVNVVPFIDLLSCCLSFLLITAAWTQLGKLQVSQAGGAGAPAAVEPLVLNVAITARGFTLSVGPGAATVELPRDERGYDLAGLLARLKVVHDRYPKQQTITVAAEDGIAYDTLVQTIDTCLRAGLGSVSVEAAS